MKKTSILLLGAGILALTACGGNKKAETATTTAAPEAEVIIDSAFQKAAAGDYKSYDKTKVITLGEDFTVKTQNDQDYYKWELAAQPQDSMAAIYLNRKGQDTDIKKDAQLDLSEGTLVIKNETYRKDK